MARLKIEDVRKEIQVNDWDLLTPVYTNLRTEMELKCPEGHIVQTTLEKWRRRKFCPTCEANPLKNVETKPVDKKTGERRILAIDQSSGVSGWAIFDDEKLISYGTFQAGRFTDTEVHFRIRSVSEWLLNMISKWEPDVVFFEDIQLQNNIPNGVIMFKILASLQGALINIVAMQDLPFNTVYVSSWRKHCEIKGRNRAERKKNAQRFVKEKYDINVSTDEADAICIGEYCSSSGMSGQMEHEMINWG